MTRPSIIKRVVAEVDGPPAFATEAYKDRNVVQRPVNALKHNRGAATRHDKLAVRFKTTVRVANIKRWLERLS